MYYYFGVIRTMYWSKEVADNSVISLSAAAKVTAWICIGGMFWLGLFPNTVLDLADAAVKAMGQ
jgi:NADH:ubiquinone oxidoreductase subunit 2 (subunit N)